VRSAGVPEQLQLSLGGVEVAMVHDAGPREGREGRLRKRFPAAAVIVFAHSHQPVSERVDGVLYLNPGSPTWKRRAAYPSVLRMVIGAGGVDATLIQLTSP
jgi:predicted phosphodiesterase